MFAISFDMVISDLEKYYGKPYHKAYYEIKKLLNLYRFEWVQFAISEGLKLKIGLILPK
jgi:virulence-associated protein VapD